MTMTDFEALRVQSIAVRRARANLVASLRTGNADVAAALADPCIARKPVEWALMQHRSVSGWGRGHAGHSASVTAARVCSGAGCTVWCMCGLLTDRQRHALAAGVQALR
jgi:hypothetical protein